MDVKIREIDMSSISYKIQCTLTGTHTKKERNPRERSAYPPKDTFRNVWALFIKCENWKQLKYLSKDIQRFYVKMVN